MGQGRFFQLIDDRPGVAALLAPLRRTLLQRTLLGALLLSIALLIAYALLGLSLTAVLIGIGLTSTAEVVLAWRGELRSRIAWVTSIAGLGMVWSEHNAMGLVVVPIATVLPALGALVEGPYLGLALFVGAEGLMLHLAQTPGLSQLDSFRLLTAAATTYTLLGVVLGWSWGLSRALAATAEAHRALEETLNRRDKLAKVIFEDVGHAQQQLAAQLASGKVTNWAKLQLHVESLISRTEQFKLLRQSLAKPSAAVPDFSAPVLRALLLLFLTLALPAAFYQAVLGHGPPWPGAVMVTVCLLSLFGLRRHTRAPRWAAWAWVVVATITLSYDVLRDRGSHLTTTLIGWGSCVVEAALLLDRRVALFIAAIGMLATLDAGHALPSSVALWTQVGSHLFAQAVVVVAILQAVDGQQRVLDNLEDKRQTLNRAMLQHRRYLGTLFHDIANPLGALNLLCCVGVDGEDVPEDVERVSHLIARIGLLLEDSRSWLLDETTSPAQAPESLDLLHLVRDLQDVFRERLTSKHMSLTVSIDAEARVRCLVSALRESVVANLLSNAIKFSEPGSTIELRAWRTGDRVHLELADRGPGLPPNLRQALESGAEPLSLPGTAGEPGQGLGLTLAIEHLRRMGGLLTFENREGGGLIVRVTLEAA